MKKGQMKKELREELKDSISKCYKVERKGIKIKNIGGWLMVELKDTGSNNFNEEMKEQIEELIINRTTDDYVDDGYGSLRNRVIVYH